MIINSMPWVNIVLFIFVRTKLRLSIKYFNKCVHIQQINLSRRFSTYGQKITTGLSIHFNPKPTINRFCIPYNDSYELLVDSQFCRCYYEFTVQTWGSIGRGSFGQMLSLPGWALFMNPSYIVLLKDMSHDRYQRKTRTLATADGIDYFHGGPQRCSHIYLYFPGP